MNTTITATQATPLNRIDGFQITANRIFRRNRADCDPKKSQTTIGQNITKEIYNLLKKYTAKNFDINQKSESQMMGNIEDKRQSWRYSKLAGLRFLDFLCQPGVEADKAVKELYLFGGSQQDHSSIYYKYS